MALGANVRRRREALGWTLDRLSEESGVDIGTISALENRDSKRSQYVHLLARALGVSVGDLQGDTEGAPLVANPRALSTTQRRALDLHDRLRHSGRELWFAVGELIAKAPTKAAAKAPKESREILPAVPTTALPRGSKKVRNA